MYGVIEIRLLYRFPRWLKQRRKLESFSYGGYQSLLYYVLLWFAFAIKQRFD
jgi:hypothetical protein